VNVHQPAKVKHGKWRVACNKNSLEGLFRVREIRRVALPDWIGWRPVPSLSRNHTVRIARFVVA
jgi:hypothetical protein